MKKTLLATLICASSFGVSAATLDVHGNIQISGKTVINEKGEWVGQTAAPKINPDDYISMTGRKLTFTTKRIDSTSGTEYKGTSVWDYKTALWSEIDYDSNGNITWGMEQLSVGTNSFTRKYYWGNELEAIWEATYEEIVPLASQVELNKTYTGIANYTGEETSPNGDKYTKAFTEVRVRTPIAVLEDYSQGDLVKNKECLVYHEFFGESGDYGANRGQYRIACKDIGIVKLWNTNSIVYTLSAIE